MSLPATHREVRLAALPEGALTPGHFEVVTAPVPVPGPGQVLVRNRLMSVAAVMRPLTLADPDTFGLPQLLHKTGEVMRGPALGEVLRAPGTELAPGTLVRHRAGWREYALLDAAQASPIDPEALPDPAAHLSQGFAAWLGWCAEPGCGAATRCSSPARRAAWAPWPGSSPGCTAPNGSSAPPGPATRPTG
ncbi:hypothetical protein SSPO_059500 [Streptomyces antimycoticus]|uniref:Oxidoreductase N-terminal domain-containing protein n=1 Tax=Streptomyces antimycoticus TaxID=68175 RepID=A0A499UQA1_9ACTN|nr:hypothetical protein SSPO_059500 [Streptomyces antimycoticus]